MMKIALALVVAVVVATTFAAAADFTKTVDSCSHEIRDKSPAAICAHWKCLRDRSAAALDTTPGQMKLLERAVNQFCTLAATGKALPPQASHCHKRPANWTKDEAQHELYKAGWHAYLQRDHEHYSENMKLRWVGIADKICPPSVPKYSDCSSFVTWCYWTVFGEGPDFVNGEDWKAGYTGTMVKHGAHVDCDPKHLQVGDAIFYYHPMHHTAIYSGNGTVFSHGYDPLQHAAWDYPGRSQVDSCRRYL